MKVIETADAPQHRGPVPQAVESGGWIFVSALFGNDPQTGRLPAEAAEEADQIFANLTAILAAAGSACPMWCGPASSCGTCSGTGRLFNRAWIRHFGDHRPARSAVEVQDFGRPGESARYMLEVQAHRG